MASCIYGTITLHGHLFRYVAIPNVFMSKGTIVFPKIKGTLEFKTYNVYNLDII